MPSLKSIRIAARAAAYLPPHALIGHVRRRLRDRIVPLRSKAFIAALDRATEALPSVQVLPSEAASRAAETVAMFFAAKHMKNVPQCFDGTFTFLNRTHAFGGADRVNWYVDMDDGRYQLWRANLSFMGYLCTAMDADPARGLALAARLCESFLTVSTFSRPSDFGDLWNSYPVSQRILALSASLIRLPTSLADSADRMIVDRFLRRNVAYLLQNLETELGFNHLERNLSALALYALAARTTPVAVRRAILAHFDHVVGDTIGEDGVQLERSPMYQALVVQSERVLREIDIFTPEQRALLDRRLASVELALAAMTLGDGMPAMFNDGWFGETPPTAALLPDSEVPGFVVLPDAGYVRFAGGGAVALFDAGPIGPNANPGHGHPDFLSIELTIGAERLLVDPGTSNYSAGKERARDRSWDQHNGPAIGGGAPVEFLGSFKVGRRTAAKLEMAKEIDGVQHAAGSLSFAGVKVSRKVTLSGAMLTLHDRWERGEGERLSRFLVPSEWRVSASDDDAVTLTRAGSSVRISVADASLTVGASSWTCRYNEHFPAHEIVVRPRAGQATTTIHWG